MVQISPITTVLTAALRLRGVLGFHSCFIHRSARPAINPSVPCTRSSTFSSKLCSVGVRKMTLSNLTAKMSFVDFLDCSVSHASDRLTQQNGNNSIQLVMGNEAGDADSIVSALSLAHVNTLCSDNTNAQNVALVSIPREDLPLRRDAVLLLDIAGINSDNLIYMDDDISNKLFTKSTALTLTLVDHNRIRSSLSHSSERVSAILDHHEDEQSHEHVTIYSGNRIIAFHEGFATVASTCTLVAEKLFQAIGTNASVDRSLGLSLLGVILLDSVNMLPEAGKGTPRDEAAIEALLKQTNWSATSKRSPNLVDETTLIKIFPNGRDAAPNRTALYDVLSGAKFDPKFWQGMSAKDCFRVDYKKFPVVGGSSVKSIGISTVLLDMNSVLEKKQFHSAMADFVGAENVDLFGVMTMYADEEGSFIRELLLSARDTNVVDAFSEYLLNHPDAAFLLIEENINSCSETSDSTLKARTFRQGNVKGSRKQVAPVLLSYACTF